MKPNNLLKPDTLYTIQCGEVSGTNFLYKGEFTSFKNEAVLAFVCLNTARPLVLPLNSARIGCVFIEQEAVIEADILGYEESESGQLEVR